MFKSIKLNLNLNVTKPFFNLILHSELQFKGEIVFLRSSVATLYLNSNESSIHSLAVDLTG